ncbi:MAG: hypothetical protein Q8O64_04385 [Sideroxyarcus sp.]|nr:hypothetical protein [Sideroxyarcus sp.]
MNLFEDTNPRALKDLLSDVHSRAMVLQPDTACASGAWTGRLTTVHAATNIGFG